MPRSDVTHLPGEKLACGPRTFEVEKLRVHRRPRWFVRAGKRVPPAAFRALQFEPAAQRNHATFRSKSRNSRRHRPSSRNTPRSADVVVTVPAIWTPRISMHKGRACTLPRRLSVSTG